MLNTNIYLQSDSIRPGEERSLGDEIREETLAKGAKFWNGQEINFRPSNMATRASAIFVLTSEFNQIYFCITNISNANSNIK